MTRGYYVLLHGRKVIDAAYLSSDAYPSYGGLDFLDAVAKELDNPGSFASWLMSLQEDSVSEWDSRNPAAWASAKQQMNLGWFKASSKNKDSYSFLDYAYLYDAKARTITVTNFGRQILHFSAAYAATAKEVFENLDWLETSLSSREDFSEDDTAYSVISDMLEEGVGYGEVRQAALSRPHIRVSSSKFRRPDAGGTLYTVDFLITDKETTRWTYSAIQFELTYETSQSLLPWRMDVSAPYDRIPLFVSKLRTHHYATATDAKNRLISAMDELAAYASEVGQLLEVVTSTARKLNSRPVLDRSILQEAAETKATAIQLCARIPSSSNPIAAACQNVPAYLDMAYLNKLESPGDS